MESLIASSYVDKMNEILVIYRAFGVQSLGLISPVGFAQIDHCLIGEGR